MRPGDRRRWWGPVFAVYLAQYAVCSALGSDAPLPYQLEVELNGESKSVLVGFEERAPGRFAARRGDLSALGLAVPGAGGDDEVVELAAMPGVTHEYDESRQKMRLRVAAEGFRPQSYDARERLSDIPSPSSGFGAILEHALALSVQNSTGAAQDELSLSFAGNFRASVFTARGVAEFGMIAGTGLRDDVPAIRLETAWSETDDTRMIGYRFGDGVSGALAWNRSIRLAGIQAQRNFSVRPDYVFAPLPTVTGSAAVPSTVELYVDNTKAYSQSVGPGPFTITNVPIISGGMARIVVRDASGRVTETMMPVYASPLLLREGVVDFSFDAGVPRRNFGTMSFDYAMDPVGFASGRYGLTPRLTVEGHVEGGLGAAVTGLGAVYAVAERTTVNAAVSVSTFAGSEAARLFAGINTRWHSVGLTGRSERAFGHFVDVATASARTEDGVERTARHLVRSVPRALDVVSVSVPVPELYGSLSLSAVRAVTGERETRTLLGASYNRPIDPQTSLYVSASHDREDGETFGFIGLTRVLGENRSAAAALAYDRSGTAMTVEAARSPGPTVGDYGWRATVTRGNTERITASGVYRAGFADVEAFAMSNDQATTFNTTVSGALLAFAGEVRAVDRLDNSFAVVEVGAPGIPVSANNSPLATTGPDGRAFLNGLLPYHANKITIDPTNLPPDTEASVTMREVTPRQRAGIVVDMKVKPAQPSALVQFVQPEGEPVPPGAVGTVDGQTEEFLVGYDGQAFIPRLGEKNQVTIRSGEAVCRASFAFRARPGEQVQINSVLCR